MNIVPVNFCGMRDIGFAKGTVALRQSPAEVGEGAALARQQANNKGEICDICQVKRP